MTGGQFIDLGAVDAGIEAEVKVLQGTRFPEIGGFMASGHRALLTHVEFILKEQFEELGVGQPIGFGFLEAQLQTAKQPGKLQPLGVVFKRIGHQGWVGGGS
jgi:hypothetical protein